VADARSVQVKARAVLRGLGHAEGDVRREYADWHFEVRGSSSWVSLYSFGRLVFFSLAGTPLLYHPGPWEQYLERLFQRTGRRRISISDRSADEKSDQRADNEGDGQGEGNGSADNLQHAKEDRNHDE
jgi:hypothetical protein